ncbi:hypothetical protein CNX65_22700 [Actinosynnema pretiosum]|uniref:Uncharacterized protein n=1 Tax=Actinosynnema pretiosum TaxID=42197 RepID=A0A290Z9R6_9PSEU|nr:hypothetical protein CNX65_22700 [Actinosynnema pretiosum]
MELLFPGVLAHPGEQVAGVVEPEGVQPLGLGPAGGGMFGGVVAPGAGARSAVAGHGLGPALAHGGAGDP